MNQAILFNDDLTFNKKHDCWRLSAMIMGEQVYIYYHSLALSRLTEVDNCTKFDLEEIAELWLEKNERTGSEIHIQLNS